MPESCYTTGELRDFALGRFDDERSEDILRHLDQCAACEDTITSLENTADSLVNHLRLPPPTDSLVDEIPAEAASAMEHAKSARPRERELADRDYEFRSAPTQVGDYRILKLLGTGGMGAVYQGVHTRLDRIVAIKILHTHRTPVRSAVERFDREIKAIGRLAHPSIVAATDAGESDGQHFLVMEYVDGVDLSRLLKTVPNGQIPIADACEIIRLAAIGIQYVHDQQLVHRDIKPSNIMLTSGGRVKILDLGLALNGEEHGFGELTTIGQVMGTLDYMAPEQCDDSHNVTCPADVYSLGATLFKLLTGTAPFENKKQLLSKLRAIALNAAPAVDSLRSDVPHGLISLISSLLEKSPETRIATAGELAASLKESCAGADLDELFQRFQILKPDEMKPEREERAIPANTNSELDGRIRKRIASHDDRAPEPAVLPISETRNFPPQGKRGFSTAIFKWLFAAIAIAACGITIWIKTDNGTLIVESDAKATLNLVKDGVTQKFEIVPGENKTQIRSGQYQIVLDEAFESMAVDKETVRLTRNGKDFARVTFKTTGQTSDSNRVSQVNSSAASDPRIEPVYLGKTYKEWVDLFRTETNQKELQRMVPALTKLSQPEYGGNARKTIDLFFEVNDKHTGKGEDLFIGNAVIAEFGEAAIEPILSRLESGSIHDRMLAMQALWLLKTEVEKEPLLDSALLKVANESPELTRMALATSIMTFGDVSAKWLPHLTQQLGLESSWFLSSADVALQLGRLGSDNTAAIAILMQLLKIAANGMGPTYRQLRLQESSAR